VRIRETSGAAEDPKTLLLHHACAERDGNWLKSAQSSKGAEDIDAGPVNTWVNSKWIQG